jgi:hypothetical protein
LSSNNGFSLYPAGKKSIVLPDVISRRPSHISRRVSSLFLFVVLLLFVSMPAKKKRERERQKTYIASEGEEG